MFVLLILILLRLSTITEGAVAPGDEDQICTDLRVSGVFPILTYSANMRVLMDSWNYHNLLPPRIGAVWDQVDNDTNNQVDRTTNVSYTISSIASLYTHAEIKSHCWY